MVKKDALGFTRAHVFYGGRVQGVGFRYTAERLALDLELAGWVKNLPDGRVEIVCEGLRPKVEALLKNIQDSLLGPYIKKVDCKWEEPTREFKDFRVEFCY